MTDVVEKMTQAALDAWEDRYDGPGSNWRAMEAGIRAALDALAESVSPEMISAARVSWNTPFYLTGDGQPGDPMKRMIEAAIRAAILAAKG